MVFPRSQRKEWQSVWQYASEAVITKTSWKSVKRLAVVHPSVPSFVLVSAHGNNEITLVEAVKISKNLGGISAYGEVNFINAD